MSHPEVSIAEQLANLYPGHIIAPVTLSGLTPDDLSLIEFADRKRSAFEEEMKKVLSRLGARQEKDLESIAIIAENSRGVRAVSPSQLTDPEYLYGKPRLLKLATPLGRTARLWAPVTLTLRGVSVEVIMDIPRFDRFGFRYLGATAWVAGAEKLLVPTGVTDPDERQQWLDRFQSVIHEENLAAWRKLFGGSAAVSVFIRSRDIARNNKDDGLQDYVVAWNTIPPF